jgi:hypothetical protein
MEKYMMLFYGGDEQMGQMSADEYQKHMQDWYDWIQKLTDDGVYISGEPLDDSAKTIRGSEKLVSDGPFIEGKEVVGGYVAFHARDWDEALKISKGCPIFDVDGNLELRKIMELEM